MRLFVLDTRGANSKKEPRTPNLLARLFWKEEKKKILLEEREEKGSMMMPSQPQPFTPGSQSVFYAPHFGNPGGQPPPGFAAYGGAAAGVASAPVEALSKRSRRVAPFVTKLYDICLRFPTVLSFTRAGDAIEIHNPKVFRNRTCL